MNSVTRAACTASALLLSGGLALVGTTAAHADNANEVPDSYDDSYSMIQGQTLTVDAAAGLLANDIATGPSPLAVVESYDYDPSEVVVNSDGSFTYTPQPGFSGVAAFQYKAGAGNWWGYSRTVTITVTAVPTVPVGAADYYSTPQDTTLTVPANGVLANDSGAVAVVDAQNLPTGLTPQFDGSFVYAPPAGFVGDVSWSYRMSDGGDTLSDWITVTISVTPVAASVPEEGGTQLPTLAYTGAGDVSTWLLGPAMALVGLGAAGAYVARRRARLS
jgi:hypothetical protein